MKKLIALLLCAAMTMSIFVGCADKSNDNGDDKDKDEVTDDAGDPTDDAGSGDAVTPDYSAGAKALPADTVMFTIDGEAATWDELYFYMWSYAQNIMSYFGEITDWDAVIPGGEETYREYVVESAISEVAYSRILERELELVGLGLTEEDEAEMQAEVDVLMESQGLTTEEELVAYLAERNCTLDIYNQMVKASILAKRYFSEMYGMSGEKLTQSDLDEYADANGYIAAKHILLKTVDDANAPLPEDEAAAVLARMEGFIAQLDAAAPEDVETVFDTIMNEQSEDTGGLMSYPNGYLFPEGYMVDEFYKGAQELAVGEYSGIIPSTYGYHIILRMPIDGEAVPYDYASYGYPMQYVAANEIFSSVVESWQEGSNIVRTPTLEALDVAQVFATPADDAGDDTASDAPGDGTVYAPSDDAAADAPEQD